MGIPLCVLQTLSLSASLILIIQQWDLNTGQIARRFPQHTAQLTTIAVRPLDSPMPPGYDPYTGHVAVNYSYNAPNAQPPTESARGQGPRNPKANGVNSSEASDDADADADTDNDYDPLFDDEGDADPPQSAGPAPSATSMLGFQPNGPPVISPAVPHMPLQMPGSTIQSSSSAPGNQNQNRTPLLDPVSYTNFSPDIFMTAGIDGQITLWDRRASSSGPNATSGVGRIDPPAPEKTPPWCISACWSADGSQIFAGRRNGTIDVWDLRKYGPGSGMGQPKPFKVLRNPPSSGPVVCVAAFPDRQHLVWYAFSPFLRMAVSDSLTSYLIMCYVVHHRITCAYGTWLLKTRT